jgi:hypothetical protein
MKESNFQDRGTMILLFDPFRTMDSGSSVYWEELAKTVFGLEASKKYFLFISDSEDIYYNRFIASDRIILFQLENEEHSISDKISALRNNYGDILFLSKRIFIYSFRNDRRFNKDVADLDLDSMPNIERIFFQRIRSNIDYKVVLFHVAFYDEIKANIIPKNKFSYLDIHSIVHATPALENILSDVATIKFGEFLSNGDKDIASGKWLKALMEKKYGRLCTFTQKEKAAHLGIIRDFELFDRLATSSSEELLIYKNTLWNNMNIRDKIQHYREICKTVQSHIEDNFTFVDAILFTTASGKHSSKSTDPNRMGAKLDLKTLKARLIKEAFLYRTSSSLDAFQNTIEAMTLDKAEEPEIDRASSEILNNLKNTFEDTKNSLKISWKGIEDESVERRMSIKDLEAISKNVSSLLHEETWKDTVNSYSAMVDVVIEFHREIFNSARREIKEISSKEINSISKIVKISRAVKREMKKIQLPEYARAIYVKNILCRLSRAWDNNIEHAYAFFRLEYSRSSGFLEVVDRVKNSCAHKVEFLLAGEKEEFQEILKGSAFESFERFLYDKLAIDMDNSGIATTFQDIFDYEVSKKKYYELNILDLFNIAMANSKKHSLAAVSSNTQIRHHDAECRNFVLSHPLGKESRLAAQDFINHYSMDARRELLLINNLSNSPFLLIDTSLLDSKEIDVNDITSSYNPKELVVPRIIAGIEYLEISPKDNLP